MHCQYCDQDKIVFDMKSGKMCKRCWSDRGTEYHRKRRKRPDVAEQRRKAQEVRHQDPYEYLRHCARTAVTRAVFHGKLVKPKTCSKCGEPGYIEGHHEDYSKPLEVTWLCARCHRKEDNAKPEPPL